MLSDRQRGVTCTVGAHEGEGLDDGGVAEEGICYQIDRGGSPALLEPTKERALMMGESQRKFTAW